jgi:hypothetical protein
MFVLVFYGCMQEKIEWIQGDTTSYLPEQHLQHYLLVLLLPFGEFG